VVRNELDPILRRLKRRKIIKENEDVIADYLARLFMHAKAQLKEEGFISDATPIEHVLTVPAIWTADACRKMQKAMTVAIEQAKFGTVEDLFLVSEPEAAATYVLGQCKKGNAISVSTIDSISVGNYLTDAILYNVARRSLFTVRCWGWYCGCDDL
jgi:molecular chaperone DnaK (HSP70)